MSDLVSSLNAALDGRYRVEREIGEGGMAVVYLAEDLRHERRVALKVLKRELAAVIGADRFLAEIKTTANLQHPHILPLFDSGEAEGFLFYVMPYVEGESLRERLEQERQLPIDEAVGIATNMAEALDYAHRQGVVHRDVKPANVLMLDGKPVISDFGIALAVGVAGGGRLTETGMSLGTPHYMSPEQATGDRGIGPPADIYALGCVLYEMLLGEPPFTGSTPQAILAKIITDEPTSVAKQRKSVPPNVAATVAKALERLPADRFSTAADCARALADPQFRGGGSQVARAGSAILWQRTAIGASAAAVLMAGVAAWALLRPQPVSERVPQRGATRFFVPYPAGVRLDMGIIAGGLSGAHRGIAISPDGRNVVFADGPTGHLYRRDVGQLEPVQIPGVDKVWFPFFSPDGEWVATFVQEEDVLKKVRLDGSDLQTLSDAPESGRSGGWAPDSTIIAVTTAMGGVWRVPDSGGELEPISIEGGRHLRWLNLLPDGSAVLAGVAPDTLIVAVRLDTGERKDLFRGTTPRYVPSGYVVFWRDDALWAVPFDARGLEQVGEPTQIVRGVAADDTNGLGRFAVSDDLLVYEALPAGDPETPAAATGLVFVQDWRRELRTRDPN